MSAVQIDREDRMAKVVQMAGEGQVARGVQMAGDIEVQVVGEVTMTGEIKTALSRTV